MSKRALALLLLAYVVLRALPIAACADVFGYNEELAKSTVAKALLDGVPLPWHTLAYVPHEGGGFAISLLEAAAFALFGPNVLAVKLVALAVGTALFAALLQLAREHFPPRTAWFLGLALLFAPGPFVRFSLLAMGTHYEACLFVALTFLFALRLAKTERGSARDAWLLGLCAGFGLYVSLQMLPAIGAAILALGVRRRGRVATRETAWAAFGFALGALPLWIMLAQAGSSVVSVRGQVSVGGGIGPLAAAWSLLSPLLDARDLLVWMHMLLFGVVLVLGVAWRDRSTRLVVLYLALFALAYVGSGLALAYDRDAPGAWLDLLRLTPPWIFLTLLAAAGCAALWERGGARRALACVAIAVAVLAGARDLVQIVGAGRWWDPGHNVRWLAHAKGYAYTEYFDKLLPRIPGDLPAKAAVLTTFHDPPHYLLPAVAQSLFDNVHATDTEALELVHAAFGERWRDALLGLGRFLHTDWRYDVPGAFARIERLPVEAREPLAEALGRAGLGPRFRPERIREQLDIEVPRAYRAAWLHGTGWRIHHAFRYRPDWAQEFLDRAPEEFQVDLGIGWAEARLLDERR